MPSRILARGFGQFGVRLATVWGLVAAPPEIGHAASSPPTAAPSGVPARDGPAALTSNESAREWMKQGAAYYSQGEWELARRAFLRAWESKRHYAISANLAEVELKLARYREAALHLSFALVHLPPDRFDERNLAREELAECGRHLVSLRVTSNVENALLKLDGEEYGRTPLKTMVWVEPGWHSLVLMHPGYRTRTTEFSRGPGELVVLGLELEQLTLARRRLVSTGRPQSASSPPRDSSSGPEPRTWVLLGGGALTMFAAGAGVGYSFKSAAAHDTANELHTMLVGQGASCAPPSTTYGAQCASLRAKNGEWRDSRVIAGAFFGAAGGLGLATVVTMLLLPGSHARQPSSADLMILPALARGQFGAVVRGRL